MSLFIVQMFLFCILFGIWMMSLFNCSNFDDVRFFSSSQNIFFLKTPQISHFFLFSLRNCSKFFSVGCFNPNKCFQCSLHCLTLALNSIEIFHRVFSQRFFFRITSKSFEKSTEIAYSEKYTYQQNEYRFRMQRRKKHVCSRRQTFLIWSLLAMC